MAIFWGYLKVFNNSVNILAETPESIDADRVDQAFKRAMGGMKKDEPLEKNDLRAKKTKLRFALIEK